MPKVLLIHTLSFSICYKLTLESISAQFTFSFYTVTFINYLFLPRVLLLLYNSRLSDYF